MARRVHIAYLSMYLGLLVAGLLLDLSWEMAVLLGAVVMLPVAVADIVTTRRRAHRPTCGDVT
ncbi:hypothetical protein [Plantactinospora sp. CA-290183]|uniref:hypothetical protein n=1 Tax=Plantactinospora sp. CA-290183 TaxID=3240006 RepID=UPI003D913D1F